MNWKPVPRYTCWRGRPQCGNCDSYHTDPISGMEVWVTIAGGKRASRLWQCRVCGDIEDVWTQL